MRRVSTVGQRKDLAALRRLAYPRSMKRVNQTASHAEARSQTIGIPKKIPIAQKLAIAAMGSPGWLLLKKFLAFVPRKVSVNVPRVRVAEVERFAGETTPRRKIYVRGASSSCSPSFPKNRYGL